MNSLSFLQIKRKKTFDRLLGTQYEIYMCDMWHINHRYVLIFWFHRWSNQLWSGKWFCLVFCCLFVWICLSFLSVHPRTSMKYTVSFCDPTAANNLNKRNLLRVHFFWSKKVIAPFLWCGTSGHLKVVPHLAQKPN